MDFLISLILDLVVKISDYAVNAWESVKYVSVSPYNAAFDILIVSVIFYLLIQWVRGTRAKQIISGLAFIGILYIIATIFQFIALEWLLRNFFTVILVAIPIIFQDEIRRGLQKLGETKLFSGSNQYSKDTIKEIALATQELIDKKLGALIVLKREVNLDEYEATGEEIDAWVGSDILLSIFSLKSPLHDGAVIVKGERISHASCILPQATKRFAGRFGTRHKAGLTLSEITDAVVIIVSEERKAVSIAFDGELFENLSYEECVNKLYLLTK